MSTASPSPARAAALLLVALLAPGGARAQEPIPAAGGALRVTAVPPRLVLGRDAGADLQVAAPPEIEEISLTTSAGRIDAVRRLPGGGFAARYHAPPDHVPRVAIVSAVARGARAIEDGWLAIPMSGEGDARVRGAPGSEITLRIGDRTFGPRIAGEDGVAVVPVVVPPGVREAHQGFRPIDLRVPETPLLHAVADRAGVRADREEKVRVVAYVVAPHGAARRGDAPLFEPSRGTVAVVEREAGAYQASWTLPPGPAGEERLTIRLPAAPASRAVLRVEAAAGPPAVVAVSFDREALEAGGEPAAVSARALDGAGNPVPAALAIEARGGDLTDVRERRPGELGARLAAGTTLRGAEAVVTATAPALGITGARALPLRPGAPAALRLDPPAVVRADGVGVAVLRVSIADRFGNAVSSAPVVTAERGRVVGISERTRGEFDVRYVAPAVARPVDVSLAARAGDARATAASLLAPPGPAFLLEGRGGLGLDLAGRFSGPTAAVAAERPADLAFAIRRGTEVAWRVEAGAQGGDRATLATVLAGASAQRELARGTVVSVAATAGALLGQDGAAPAARLAISAGLQKRFAVPFLEVSLLAAGGGAPGAFAALGLSAGIRLGVEADHGHDPDRR